MADGEHIADRLRSRKARAVRAIVFMNRLFEYECRDLGLSLAQYRLLLYLRHGPKRAGELAAQASITRPSMSAMIAALERQSLIARAAVDADRRGVRLELTRKGLVVIARAEQRFSAILDDASQGCDASQLLTALEELARKLNDEVGRRARADEA